MTGGTLFEELGFYYVGPIDGHNLDHLLPVLRNVRDAEQRPDPRPCRDPEGQGLRAGRERPPTSITASPSSTSSPARRRRRSQRADLHQGLRRQPDQGGARRTTRSSRSPPRCRPAPASTCSARHFPTRTFDVGIAEQHARDLRRRPRHRGLEAVRRDLLDLPAARLRPGRARRRDPEPAGALRDRPRRARRRRRADPCRLRSTSPISAACRISWSWRRRDEAELVHMVRDRGRDRRPARRASAIRAAKASASTCRSAACRSRSARAASCARARKVALLSLRRAARRMPEGGRGARAATACRRRSPTRASPSRSTPTWCSGWRASTRC